MRRIWLFIKDYYDEFGVAWSVARSRDCERNGGHRWGGWSWDDTLQATGRSCSRCGTWAPVPYTSGTGSATITIWPNFTTGTRGSKRA